MNVFSPMNDWGDLLTHALSFAERCHRGQFRDGPNAVPYLCHPIEVLVNLRSVGGITDEQICAACLLHDVLEECPVTEEEMRSEFGDRVTDLVLQVTRQEPSEEQTASLTPDEKWALRSQMLLAEISAMGPEAQIIKLADRLSNLREAKMTRTGKKLLRYMKQTDEILKIIPKSANGPLWNAIESELKRLRKS